MGTSREIVRSTSLLSLITVFSLGFGFFKEITVANYFGAGELVDAFLVASIIPLAFPRILTSVIDLSLIPAYIETRKRNEIQAQNLLNFVLIIMLIFFTVCSVFFYWKATSIISWLAPGFEERNLLLAARLLKVMLPILLFFGLFRLSASLLNAHRSFLFPGASVLIAPTCVVAAIVLFRRQFGVLSWAVGLTLGYALQAALLLTLIYRRGIKLGFRLNLRDSGVSRFAMRALPLMCATGINTMILVIDRAMASKLVTGSISALSYADKIFQLPLQTFILSLATVIVPYMSLQFLDEDKRAFKGTIQLAILMAAFVLLPVTTGLCVLARPIVAILLQRGAFATQDTQATSLALLGYASGLFFVAIYYILQRILIVIRKTHLLIGIAVANIALKFLLNLLFIPILGATGIAVATSVMFTVTTILMLILAFRFVDGFEIRHTLFTVLKLVIAALVMGSGCLFIFAGLSKTISGESLWTQIFQVVLVSLIGAGIYSALIWALRIPEARKLYGFLLQFNPFRKT